MNWLNLPRESIVAQSIFQQMKEHHEDYVYLSLKHLDPEKIKKRFPNIFEKCAELGIDMTDRIPVAPAAHYTVGGVKTDLTGRTNIPHLYVCGELASSGIMGANRLASNSLIECLVFGKRAVEDSVRNRREDPIPEIHTFILLGSRETRCLPVFKKQGRRHHDSRGRDYPYGKRIAGRIGKLAPLGTNRNIRRERILFSSK